MATSTDGDKPTSAPKKRTPAPNQYALDASFDDDDAGDGDDGDALETFGRALDLSFEDDTPAGDADLEQRAVDLSQRLQLDPTDDAVADQLIEVLTALNRGHELLAVLLARLEDATDERRDALRERTREVLVNLAERVESAGHADEAGLFRMAADNLP